MKTDITEPLKSKSDEDKSLIHQLRSPLSVILGMASQIDQNEEATAIIKEHSRTIIRNIHIIAEMLQSETGSPQQEASEDRSDSHVNPHAQKIKLLIADDNEEIRMIFETVLQNENTQVVCAETGKDAIQCIESGSLDIIFMDIKLPYLNGIEVCQWVRSNERFEDLPIIALSGSSPDDFEENQLNCFNGFIKKPFQMDQVINYINEELFTCRNLPVQLLLLLKDKALVADYKEVLNVNQQLKKYNSILATQFEDLINQFEFEKLIQRVEQSIGQNQKEKNIVE